MDGMYWVFVRLLLPTISLARDGWTLPSLEATLETQLGAMVAALGACREEGSALWRRSRPPVHPPVHRGLPDCPPSRPQAQ